MERSYFRHILTPRYLVQYVSVSEASVISGSLTTGTESILRILESVHKLECCSCMLTCTDYGLGSGLMRSRVYIILITYTDAR